MRLTDSDLNSSTVSWVSDPDGRGTFSLIASCVLTMGLCVWTALHLNLPSTISSKWQFWLESVQWAVTGIFAPELVVFAAWRQNISARVLQNTVEECTKMYAPERTNDETRCSSVDTGEDQWMGEKGHAPWTMVHGFYAGMGGFTFEVDFSDEESDLFGVGHPRLTITPRGVALLARCGRLPHISKEDIVDKSKSDGIAKSVACLQAGWMIVQILGRVALDLPVTLLEINTLGHILCAFVIYILWWHKPQTILEPTKLEGAWIKPLCAYMYMCSKISHSGKHSRAILAKHLMKPELSGLVLLSSKSSSLRASSDNHNQGEPISAATHVKEQTSLPPLAPPPIILGLDCSDTFRFYNRRQKNDYNTATDLDFLAVDIERNDSPIHFRRWQLAAEAVNKYPAIRSRFSARQCDDVNAQTSTLLWEPSADAVEDLIVDRAGNWPRPGLLRGMGGLIMGMVLWFASMAFGGVHASAWNGYFPSTVESWLWRASSVHVIFCGFLWLVINLLAKLFKQIDLFWDRVVALQAHRMTYLVLGILCFLGGFTFVLARIYLVLEAFVSLRKLPVSAYETPDWTQLLPHF